MKTIPAAMLEEAAAAAEKIITKWPAVDAAAATLFHGEARGLLSTVVDLKHAMNFYASRSASSALLSRAHRLIESAMSRLQKELHRLLSANRNPFDANHLGSSSSSSSGTDEEKAVLFTPTAAMDDLRSIAECMAACGYTKECVKEYAAFRRCTLEEGLHRLGYVKMTPSQVQKLDWEVVRRRIGNWVNGSRAAVRTLFAGEWFLCEYVFGFSDAVKEAVFAEAAREPAVQFLHFAEMASSKRKTSPEKIFHFLDMYAAIYELLPEIESLFSHRSTAAVTRQARASLSKLADFVTKSLGEFESAIHKVTPKGNVPGGGVHPLSRYVMNYLTFLADYDDILGVILAGHPLLPPKPLPEPFVELLTSPATTAPPSPSRHGEEKKNKEEEKQPQASPAVFSHVAWLVLLLLGKLDAKAEVYHDAPLSYLFLANNLRYVVNKVRTSNLRRLFGDVWVTKHEEKARAFARGYERLGWRRVVEAIPTDVEKVVKTGGVEVLKVCMAEFGSAFEEAYRKQRGWVVKDRWMREELKLAIAGKVMAPYREFYESYLAVVGRKEIGFTPDDIGNYLSDLFYGAPGASSSGSSSGSSSRSSKPFTWRSG